MNIREAVALKRPIRRSSWTPDLAWIQEGEEGLMNWQDDGGALIPSAEDLLADDWIAKDESEDQD